jgi:hypothetical protein
MNYLLLSTMKFRRIHQALNTIYSGGENIQQPQALLGPMWGPSSKWPFEEPYLNARFRSFLTEALLLSICREGFHHSYIQLDVVIDIAYGQRVPPLSLTRR